MIDLYIMRHGLSQQAPGQSDAVRPLSAAGAQLLSEAAPGLAARGVRLKHILHSPLLRAKQTAEIVALSHAKVVVQPLAALAPGGALDTIFARLETLAAPLMIVGHLPDVCGLLVSCTGDPAHHHNFFEAGGIAWLQAPLWDRGLFRLKWLKALEQWRHAEL